MPLRPLIDLSINQTPGRTVATSLTVVLSILPLALVGGPVMRGFALAIIFGIVVGTSSSIFIASPILLFLGEKTAAAGDNSGCTARRFRCGAIIKSQQSEAAGPAAKPDNPGKSLDSDVPGLLGTIG